MNAFTLASSRISFGMALAVSWILVTFTLALAAWSGEHTPGNLVRWGSLWFFSVVPTIESLTVHRRLNDLLHARSDVPDRVIRDLTHARWTFLMFATMVVLTAFALGLGR